MHRVLRHHHHVSLILHELRDRIFCRLRAAKPAVEQIALLGLLSRHARRAHANARHRRDERDFIERRAREPDPGASVRGRPRGTERLQVRRAVSKRKLDQNFTGAAPVLDQRGTHVFDQRIDHEQQPHRIFQCVLDPVERCVRQLALCRRKERLAAAIVSAREPPQRHTLCAEPHFDRFVIEHREFAATAYANAEQQRLEPRRRVQYIYGKECDERAVCSRRNDRHRSFLFFFRVAMVAMSRARRKLGGDGSVCKSGARAGDAAIAEQHERGAGERELFARTEAARINPEHSPLADCNVRRAREQHCGEFRPGNRGTASSVLGLRSSVLVEVPVGLPGRVPKTNEAHVTVPESETPRARSNRASAPARECERPALQPDHQTDRVAIGSDRARCARRCEARPWWRAA